MTFINFGPCGSSSREEFEQLSSTSWESIRDTLAAAAQTTVLMTSTYGNMFALYIKALPDTEKPSWWNEHREEFSKLSAAVEENSRKITEVAEKIIASEKAQEREALEIPLTSNKFPQFITHLVQEGHWNALGNLITRIATAESKPSWWTNELSRNVESVAMQHRHSIFNIGDSFKIYLCLGWKKAILAFAFTELIQKKDYSQLLSFLDSCNSHPPISTWLQEDTTIQQTLLKVIQENKAKFQSLTCNNKSAFQIFCELKIKPLALVLASQKTLLTPSQSAVFGFEHLTNHFSAETVIAVVSRFSLNTEETALLITTLFKHGKKEPGKERMAAILQKASEQRPSWFTNPKFATPLFMALMEQKEYELACHLTSYININYKDELERTPFFFVLQSQNKALIRLFLDKGADSTEISKVPNAKKAWEYIEELERGDINSLLSTMSLDNKESTLKRLRYFYSSHNTNGIRIITQRLQTEKPEWLTIPQDATDLFCLVLECTSDDIDFATSLIPLIDVNGKHLQYPQNTPLDWCLNVNKKYKPIARLLIQHGASLSKPFRRATSTTYLKLLTALHVIFVDELPTLLPVNSPSIFRDIQLLQQKAPAVAQELSNKVLRWIDVTNGKIPNIQDREELDALYDVAGPSLATSILEAMPLTQTSFNLLRDLCKYNHIASTPLALRFISLLGAAKQPTWWNAEKAFHLYLNIMTVFPGTGPEALYPPPDLHQEGQLELINALLPHFDTAKLSNKSKKALLDAVFVNENPALISGLIEAGMTIDKKTVDIIAVTYGAQKAIQILEKLSLKGIETYSLLRNMITDKKQESRVLPLLNRLIDLLVANQRPSWCTSSRATDLFFILLEQKTTNSIKAAKRLLPYIDCIKTNPRDKNRTPLLVALENNFTATEIAPITQRSSLFHIDDTGTSALSVALQKPNSVPVSLLQQCLRQCALPEENVAACTSYETLQKYIEATLTDENPSHCTARIILNLLYNKKNEVKELVKTIPLSVRLDLVSNIGKIGGELLQNAFIDCAFSIDSSHFTRGTQSVKIPPKEDPSMDIEEALLDLYDTYAVSKSEAERNKLIEFAARVNNRTTYIGTPLPNTDALTEFYTIIDNATCNTIFKLKRDLQNAKASEEQNYLLGNFFHEIVDAASQCGGRYMSTAVQQYSRIVLGIQEDVQSTFLTQAALRREYLAAELVNKALMLDEQTQALVPEDNTTHLYVYLLNAYGKKLGLPGAQLTDSFEDSCLWPRHREQAKTIATEFLLRYTPVMITEFMHQELVEEPLKGRFEAQLFSGTHTDWYDIHVPLIMQEIEKRITTPPTTAQAEVIHKVMAARSAATQAPQSRIITATELATIEDFLAEAPYYITLAATAQKRAVIHTLDDVTNVLRNDPKLYWMLSHEGKSFTKESIIRELLNSKVLSPIVIPRGDIAIHDEEYRNSLVDKLQNAHGDLTVLSSMELEQLKRAGSLVTSLDLSSARCSSSIINARVQLLLPLFPQLSSLDLHNTEMSELPPLPVTLKQLYLDNCPIRTLPQTIFASCVSLQTLQLNNSKLTEFNCTLPASLKELHLAYSRALTHIGDEVFSQCTQLEYFDALNCDVLSSITCPFPASLRFLYFGECWSLTSLDPNLFRFCKTTITNINFLDSAVDSKQIVAIRELCPQASIQSGGRRSMNFKG